VVGIAIGTTLVTEIDGVAAGGMTPDPVCAPQPTITVVTTATRIVIDVRAHLAWTRA
jgi:hypothetical protein